MPQNVTHLSTHLSISLRKQHSLCKMPLTLKQLQNRRDQCLERIEEHEAMVLNIGGDMNTFSFNASEFFRGLSEMTNQDIEFFLEAFTQLPRVLDLARQAATEEQKRRKYEANIAKKTAAAAVKWKHRYEVHAQKERKAKRRMARLKGVAETS